MPVRQRARVGIRRPVTIPATPSDLGRGDLCERSAASPLPAPRRAPAPVRAPRSSRRQRPTGPRPHVRGSAGRRADADPPSAPSGARPARTVRSVAAPGSGRASIPRGNPSPWSGCGALVVRRPSTGGPRPAGRSHAPRAPGPPSLPRAAPSATVPDPAGVGAGDRAGLGSGPDRVGGQPHRPRGCAVPGVSSCWDSASVWADSRIDHVDALSQQEDTPGTTYLIAGSDRRDGTAVSEDGTEGARTDTIMLLHRARNGSSYLISLPRDTLVEIPGQGRYKLNAAFAMGGAALLVETVEEFTGLTIDHYVEVGFDGVAGVVDAVDHVNLCIDQDVDDDRSGLQMTEGCHDVGGEQALAFVRARYFDPTADMGRQERQQQFVGALMDRATSPAVLLNPVSQVRMAGAGSDALITSEGTGIIDVGRMALTARSAMNGGGTLSMPISDPEFQTVNSGGAVLVDEEEIATFFAAVADGSAETGE